jgi:hypothetical protein
VIERAASAALDSLTKAANDTATAVIDKGLNVRLDLEAIEEQLFKTLVSQLETLDQPPSATAKESTAASAATPKS